MLIGKIFPMEKIFGPEKILDKKSWGKKLLGQKNIFWPEKILGLKKLLVQKCLCPKIIGSKNF